MPPRRTRTSRAAWRCGCAALLALLARAQGSERRTPIRRLQSLSLASASGLAGTATDLLLGGVGAARDPELDLMMEIAGGAVDPLRLLQMVSGEDLLEPLYSEPAVMSRLLEEMPLLTALPGFKAAAAAGSDAEMADGFRAGVEGLHGLLSTGRAMDATKVAESVADLLSSDDPEVKELLKQAQGGSLQAHQQLRSRLQDVLLPGGLDLDGVKASITHTHPSRLADVPEVMHYLDQDPAMSRLIRNFPHDTQDVLDLIG